MKIHRQESGVIGCTLPNSERQTMPTLIPAARMPETVGRDVFGQHSATSATPLGHMPPTPRPTRNRSSSMCSQVSTNAPSPANNRVEQDADAHRPSAADAVAEIAEQAAADRGAEHQRGREPGEPLAADLFRVFGAEQTLRHGERRDRHQAQFDAVEHQAEKRGSQHRIAARPAKVHVGWRSACLTGETEATEKDSNFR